MLGYLDSLNVNKVELGLDRIKDVMHLLGDIHDKISVIHIAGTNGKGSTAFFINNILTANGYKVGLYTSPHLNTVYERIKINNKNISRKDFDRVSSEIKGIIEENNIKLSYFEFLTAVAIKYFYDKKVDILVLEVGLGGRFDATNIFKRPLVTILTNVSFDHTEYLGNSLESILSEKMGIFREGVPIVTGVKEKGLQDIIRKKAGELEAPLYIMDSQNKEEDESSLPKHQVDNFLLAAKAIKLLDGYNISHMPSLTKLSNKNFLPGRLEFVEARDNRLGMDVLFDVCHNEAGIKVFSEYIKGISDKYDNVVIVFGMKRDKDYKACVKLILDLSDNFYITAPISAKFLDIELIKEEFSRHNALKKVKLLDYDYKNIINDINKNFGARDLLCIMGSFIIVGDIRGEIVNA